MVEHPSDKEFSKLVSNKTVKTVPINPIDITHARVIFGPYCASVKGKTRRVKPVRADGLMFIPYDFHRLHHFVTLTADVIFVNSYPFLIMLSWKLRLFTIEHIPTRTYC